MNGHSLQAWALKEKPNKNSDNKAGAPTAPLKNTNTENKPINTNSKFKRYYSSIKMGHLFTAYPSNIRNICSSSTSVNERKLEDKENNQIRSNGWYSCLDFNLVKQPSSKIEKISKKRKPITLKPSSVCRYKHTWVLVNALRVIEKLKSCSQLLLYVKWTFTINIK